jgi:hypothetical protein
MLQNQRFTEPNFPFVGVAGALAQKTPPPDGTGDDDNRSRTNRPRSDDGVPHLKSYGFANTQYSFLKSQLQYI